MRLKEYKHKNEKEYFVEQFILNSIHIGFDLWNKQFEKIPNYYPHFLFKKHSLYFRDKSCKSHNFNDLTLYLSEIPAVEEIKVDPECIYIIWDRYQFRIDIEWPYIGTPYISCLSLNDNFYNKNLNGVSFSQPHVLKFNKSINIFYGAFGLVCLFKFFKQHKKII